MDNHWLLECNNYGRPREWKNIELICETRWKGMWWSVTLQSSETYLYAGDEGMQQRVVILMSTRAKPWAKRSLKQNLTDDMIEVMGDLNAEVRNITSRKRERELCEVMSDNREKLCGFCSLNRLVVTWTIIPHKEHDKIIGRGPSLYSTCSLSGNEIPWRLFAKDVLVNQFD